jgi:predicted metal-dependent phosphoesterase TrpH
MMQPSNNLPILKGVRVYATDRVSFERPDLKQLARNFTAVDLHFHSHYSDGLNHVDKIAHRARKLGIGVAITDHNDIRGAIEIDQYDDILTIPGIEITAAEGSHLLVYFNEIEQLRGFYARDVAPYMGNGVMSSLRLPMVELIERARTYPSLVVFAHPYCAMYTGVCNLQFSKSDLQKMFAMVDGVEALNASNLNKWNLRCTVLGFNIGKAMVGGSDGHALNHMGRAVTYARCPGNRHDFLDTIRKGTNQVVGKEIALLRKMTSNSLKLRSNLNNCPDLVEKHLRYGRKVINFKSRALRSNVRRTLNHHINPANLRSYFGL